jgi:O-antigen ligase
MSSWQKESRFFPVTMLFLYITFFTGLIFSFRAVSSISTGLILLTGLLLNRKQTGSFLSEKLKNPFIACCSVYFLFQFIFLFNSHDFPEAWRQIQIKAGLLFVPLAVCCCDYINSVTRKKLLALFSILLATACLYCLIMSFIHYINTSDTSHFFYHSLVSPLEQHAVYFSLLVFVTILFLLENVKTREWLHSRMFHLTLTLFFSFFLILLSSKLVIIFFGVYLIYFFWTLRKTMHLKKGIAAVFILCLLTVLSLLFITNNPVSNRFKEVLNGNLAIVQQENYQPADYFTGLQFRLLQWKLVPEILNETKSWWTGVGPENAKPILDQKYISKNMYSGKPGTSDTGYLVYNTHNQLLESLLKTGIPGAFLFLLIFFSMLNIARKNKKPVLLFSVLLLLIYSFSESILETQYGVIIFTFFPLFLSQE